MSDKRLSQIDMNLLITLDALLSEGSVAGAAQRMNLSAPAMSRQLTRIRELFDDPILVRAGRGLVPTPRAEELRERLRQFVLSAEMLVRGEGDIDPQQLERTFTVRSNDGFVGAYGAAIAQAVFKEAAKVRLYFAPQGNEDVEALREGKVDLDIGVIGAMGPEVRLQALFHDRFIGVVRHDHPIAKAGASLENFVAYPHVSVSRRGRFDGPIDKALATHGMSRTVSLAVASFSESLEIVRRSDYIAAMPDHLTYNARRDLFSFPLPVDADALAISQAWHPRIDADPAHRWLRALIRRICTVPV